MSIESERLDNHWETLVELMARVGELQDWRDEITLILERLVEPPCEVSSEYTKMESKGTTTDEPV